MAQAHRIIAPVLILHADNATTATVTQAETLAGTLSARGPECEIKIFAVDTRSLPRHTVECIEMLAAFLRVR